MSISAINTWTLEKLEHHLTPLPENSTQWRIVHYTPALVFLPMALTTVCVDMIRRIVLFVAFFFIKDKRDPNQDFTAVCDDSRKWKEIKHLNVRFNPEFLLGTASCFLQDSGTENCPNAQWNEWEKKVVSKDNQSGKSADIMGLISTREGTQSLIERLKKAGVNSYRTSLPWDVLEPEKGKFDDVKLQLFINFFKNLRKNGIHVMVTLHHFAEPKWFHDLGSFEKEENITHFTEFCKKVYPALSQNYKQHPFDFNGTPLVEHICTINEPTIEAFSRYVRGAFSPGYLMRFHRAGIFLQNTLKAHGIAYKTLKQMNDKVQIGFTHQRLVMQASNPLLGLVTRYLNRLLNDTVMELFKTKVFNYKIPFVCNLEEKFEFENDFVGVQYYVRPLIGFSGTTSYHEPMTQMPFREDPEGLYEAAMETYQASNKPIIITENGISTHDDEQRARYLERALYTTKQVQKVIGEQNLKGYYHWSFCDNFEWDMGMKPQAFGAFALTKEGKIAYEPKKGFAPFIRTAQASALPVSVTAASA